MGQGCPFSASGEGAFQEQLAAATFQSINNLLVFKVRLARMKAVDREDRCDGMGGVSSPETPGAYGLQPHPSEVLEVERSRTGPPGCARALGNILGLFPWLLPLSLRNLRKGPCSLLERQLLTCPRCPCGGS